MRALPARDVDAGLAAQLRKKAIEERQIRRAVAGYANGDWAIKADQPTTHDSGALKCFDDVFEISISKCIYNIFFNP